MTAGGSAVLIIDSDRRSRARISRIVRSVVPSAEAVSNLDDGRSLACIDLIVANYDGLSDADRARLFATLERDEPDGSRLLLISSSTLDFEHLFLELSRHRLTNVLAQDREVSTTELIVTTQKLLRRDIFGLDKYFGWGIEQTAVSVNHSREIRPLVERITEFAKALHIHPRLVEKATTVVDELITNAVYNAPVDVDGARRYAHLPRTAPVALAPHESVTLSYCCDGHTLGLSVSDSFGAMSKQESLDYLVNCLRRTEDAPSQDKGGAGLGLYMTLESVNHLVLNLHQGARTEVIGLIDVRGSYRDFVYRGKSFNIFLDTPRTR